MTGRMRNVLFLLEMGMNDRYEAIHKISMGSIMECMEKQQ